ncbi:MAG: AMP-binding protein [Bdellovibrionales bacterium]|nr:AMP-binding protein [Bdellovibrionales bacterium]
MERVIVISMLRINDFDVSLNEKSSALFFNPQLTLFNSSQIESLKKKLQGYPETYWFATSGSTGLPKFIGLEKDSILFSAKRVNQWIGLSSNDTVGNVLPLFHVGGYAAKVRAEIAGAQWVDGSEKPWSPEEFYQLLTNHAITVTSLVPTQLYDLISRGFRAPSKLKVLFIGGGRLSFQTFEKAQTLGWPVYSTFGMTESGSQMATVRVANDWDEQYGPRLRFLPGVHYQEDKETARLEIQDQSLLSYRLTYLEGAWHLEKISKQNWFKTQDRVKIHSDDYGEWVQILDRSDRSVKVLGELINLDGLQQRLDHIAEDQNVDFNEFYIASVRHARKQNELILVAGFKNSRCAQRIIREFNKCAKGIEKLSAIYHVREIPKSSLGKRRNIIF